MPGYYLIAAGVIGVVTLLFLPRRRTGPLRDSQPSAGSVEEAREIAATMHATR